MHIRDQRAYAFCQQLYPLIRQADMYWGEMDLAAVQPAGQPSYNILDHFSPRAFHKVRQQLIKSFGVDIQALGAYHPMLIISVISQQVLQSEHQVSLDEHLWKYAGAEGKALNGLESYEEQSGLLYSIDPAPMYKQIGAIASRPWKIRRQTRRMMEWYLDGDIHQLYRMAKSSLHRLRKVIVYQRNKTMAARIGAMDRDQSHFIAVGVGHLSGRWGLISLLKSEGWSLTPIPMDDRSSFI